MCIRDSSNTTRHAAEFWMIEPEIAFADLKDDMVLAESMLKYVIRYVLEHAPEEMEFFNKFVDKGLPVSYTHLDVYKRQHSFCAMIHNCFPHYFISV